MTAAKEPQGPKVLRVVLAEDNEDLRVTLRTLLQTMEGIEVVGEASEGRSALAVIQETKPDVVVMDLAMPHLDGLQVAQLVRSERDDVILIALTGYRWDTLSDQADMAGFDHFLLKGGSMRDLEGLLTRYQKA